MNAEIIALVAAFAVPLGNASFPPNTDVEVLEAADSQPPPEPTILEVAADEVLQPNGLRVRWAAATYELSSGQEAELFVEVDEHGSGDGLIYVDGEALMHVTTDGDGVTTTWVAPDLGLPPQAVAQLTTANIADEIFAGIGDPQEFPCSEFGKSAVKAAKYLWVAVNAAAGILCCAAGVTLGCVVCGGAAAASAEWGGDVADDYCD